jgi:hypothetical protein
LESTRPEVPRLRFGRVRLRLGGVDIVSHWFITVFDVNNLRGHITPPVVPAVVLLVPAS